MIAISCDNISFSVGVEDILKNISFSLNTGDRLGLVGVNGAGKSTLLRIIAGKTEATSGHVYFEKGSTVAMLEQNDAVSGNNTPEEELLLLASDLITMEKQLEKWTLQMEKGNLENEQQYHRLHDEFLEKGGYEFRGRLKGVLRSLGFTDEGMKMKCELLSGGQKTRLALAKILFTSPDILILDEPTNHLDTETLEWLEEFLCNYRKTVLVVSHDRYFLDKVTTKTLDIENHLGKIYNGNYSTFLEKKKKDIEIQERHYKNQQKEIERIEAYIALQRRWNREKNIIAAESRQKQLDKMERVEKVAAAPKAIRLKFETGLESGNDVLKVKKLSKAYGDKVLFKDLSFEVKKGDRLFIIGSNGCGKSTLMKIIKGVEFEDAGSCNYGYNLQFGYYDQENQRLCNEKTVLDELWDLNPSMTEQKVRSALAMFNFTKDEIEKEISVLSGGERARLTFCKLVLSKNNILLLDEPTNHLDINTKDVLEGALQDYDGTLICVSHDRYFINKLATCILDFNYPKGPYFFHGTYLEYQNYKKRSLENGEHPVEEKEPISSSKEQYLLKKQEQAEQRKLKNKLERSKKEAKEIEEELERLSEEESRNATDYVKLSLITAKKEELDSRLLELYELIMEYDEE